MESKRRILAVEDEPVSAELVRGILQHLGFEVDLARNGEEAVQMWEGGEYDVVFMDVQMPQLDGLSAARLIREKEETRGGHVKIIAMTAHNDPEALCLAAGMDAVLQKPLDFTKSEVLEQLLWGNEQ